MLCLTVLWKKFGYFQKQSTYLLNYVPNSEVGTISPQHVSCTTCCCGSISSRQELGCCVLCHPSVCDQLSLLMCMNLMLSGFVSCLYVNFVCWSEVSFCSVISFFDIVYGRIKNNNTLPLQKHKLVMCVWFICSLTLSIYVLLSCNNQSPTEVNIVQCEIC